MRFSSVTLVTSKEFISQIEIREGNWRISRLNNSMFVSVLMDCLKHGIRETSSSLLTISNQKVEKEEVITTKEKVQ